MSETLISISLVVLISKLWVGVNLVLLGSLDPVYHVPPPTTGDGGVSLALPE